MQKERCFFKRFLHFIELTNVLFHTLNAGLARRACFVLASHTFNKNNKCIQKTVPLLHPDQGEHLHHTQESRSLSRVGMDPVSLHAPLRIARTGDLGSLRGTQPMLAGKGSADHGTTSPSKIATSIRNQHENLELTTRMIISVMASIKTILFGGRRPILFRDR